jgi:hypothetical protein
MKLVTICKFENVRPTFGSVVFSNSEQCSPGNSGKFESGECYVFFVSSVLFFHVVLKIVKIKMFKKSIYWYLLWNLIFNFNGHVKESITAQILHAQARERKHNCPDTSRTGT